MVNNTLDKIIKKKKERLIKLKKSLPLESIKVHQPDSMDYIDFRETIELNISEDKISIIAEIKKASPSAGIIVQDYNPVKIAKKFNDNKVTCLSVLTEEEFFLGSLNHIYKIKSKMIPMNPSSMHLPILCKDFFIDPYQVHLAKYYGADAILIILSAVTENMANQLYEEALKLNMSVIVEVHTKDEAKYSLKFSDALIGINNRNLKTLKTDINTTFDIHDILIDHKGPLISESGIETRKELLEITKKTKIKTFLIGESLLKSLNKNSIFSVL
jgi:indole-3-glycerol phosphate synthase